MSDPVFEVFRFLPVRVRLSGSEIRLRTLNTQTRILNIFMFWSYGIFLWRSFAKNILPTPGYMTQINTSLTYHMWHVWQKRTLKRFIFTYSEYQQTKSLIGLEMTQRVQTVVSKSLNRGESWVKLRRNWGDFFLNFRLGNIQILWKDAIIPLFNLKYDVKNLSPKETAEIRDLFNLFDIDGNGSINKETV